MTDIRDALNSWLDSMEHGYVGERTFVIRAEKRETITSLYYKTALSPSWTPLENAPDSWKTEKRGCLAYYPAAFSHPIVLIVKWDDDQGAKRPRPRWMCQQHGAAWSLAHTPSLLMSMSAIYPI